MDEDIQENCDKLCKSDQEQLSEDEVGAYRASCSTRLDSTLTESDDEVSTKKEKHWRLGSENLDDTVVYDFLDIE